MNDSVGYRFAPTDEEIIHILQRKMEGLDVPGIKEADFCKYNPWELPPLSLLPDPNKQVWHFFGSVTCENTKGERISRRTNAGYWRVTGKPTKIKGGRSGVKVIGTKTILVFYEGGGREAVRTNWVVREFCSTDSDLYQKKFRFYRLRRTYDFGLRAPEHRPTHALEDRPKHDYAISYYERQPAERPANKPRIQIRDAIRADTERGHNNNIVVDQRTHDRENGCSQKNNDSSPEIRDNISIEIEPDQNNINVGKRTDSWKNGQKPTQNNDSFPEVGYSITVDVEPENSDHVDGRAYDRKIGWSQKPTQNNDSFPEVGDSITVDVEPENSGHVDGRAYDRKIGWSQKVSLELIFTIINFFLEVPSVVFDQLSSVHKPQYALYAMLVSFTAMLFCIVELAWKGRKEKVIWRWGMFPWFYYPSGNEKPFGNFKETVGPFCALCQCIITGINYVQTDKPIQISVWPIIYAFSLLCSKILDSKEDANVLRQETHQDVLQQSVLHLN